MSTTATLANDALLSQCADFVETMLHRFLKAESEKPIPPTPADLQPAVNTLWRLSIIRKYLSEKPSPTAHPVRDAILSKSGSSPTQVSNASLTQLAPHSTNTHAYNFNLHTSTDSVISPKSIPSENSVISVAPYEISPTTPPTAPTAREVLQSISQVEKLTRALQREIKSRAAQSQSPPAIASPPKFRYPPPKRTSV